MVIAKHCRRGAWLKAARSRGHSPLATSTFRFLQVASMLEVTMLAGGLPRLITSPVLSSSNVWTCKYAQAVMQLTACWIQCQWHVL